MFRLVRRSLKLIGRQNFRRYIILVGARTTANFLDVAGLIVLGGVATILFSKAQQNEVSFLSFDLGKLSGDTTLLGATLVFLFFTLKSVFGAVLLRRTTKFLGKVEGQKSIEIAKKFFSKNLDDFESHSVAEILWTLNTSSQMAFSSVLYNWAALVSETALLILVGATLFFIDPASAAFLVLYFALISGLFQVWINRPLKRLGQRLELSTVRGIELIENLFRAFPELKARGAVSYPLNKYNAVKSDHAYDWAFQRFLLGVPRYFVEGALVAGITVFVGLQFWLNGAAGLVTAGVFVAGGVRLMAALLPLQNAYSELRISASQANRALEFLEESNGIEAEPSNGELALKRASLPSPAGIVVENLSYQFKNQSTLQIRDVSFEVAPGEMLAIVGPSGSGKSTLAELIAGLRQPTAGLVKVGGIGADQALETRPGYIGYVPQFPATLVAPLWENVVLEDSDSLSPEKEARFLDALSFAQLRAFDFSKKGANEPLATSELTELSGGERQRIGLARAIYSKPSVLVLDEPTSALDPESENIFNKTILQLRQSATIIIVAHRMSTLEYCDSVLLLDDGGVLEKCAVSELSSNPKIAKFIGLLHSELSQPTYRSMPTEH